MLIDMPYQGNGYTTVALNCFCHGMPLSAWLQ